MSKQSWRSASSEAHQACRHRRVGWAPSVPMAARHASCQWHAVCSASDVVRSATTARSCCDARPSAPLAKWRDAPTRAVDRRDLPVRAAPLLRWARRASRAAGCSFTNGSPRAWGMAPGAARGTALATTIVITTAALAAIAATATATITVSTTAQPTHQRRPTWQCQKRQQ